MCVYTVCLQYVSVLKFKSCPSANSRCRKPLLVFIDLPNSKSDQKYIRLLQPAQLCFSRRAAGPTALKGKPSMPSRQHPCTCSTTSQKLSYHVPPSASPWVSFGFLLPFSMSVPRDGWCRCGGFLRSLFLRGRKVLIKRSLIRERSTHPINPGD